MSNWKAEVMFSSENQDWRTPGWLYSVLDDEFVFELDAAASKQNACCGYWFDEELDALSQDWINPTAYQAHGLENPAWAGPPWERVWLNPPYGRNVGKWVEKAFNESRKGLTVVMLVMASTDTEWWHTWASRATQIRLLKGRLKFSREENISGPAPKGSAVLVFAPWWDGPPQITLWNPPRFVT